MTMMTRMIRLWKADLHGVMDQIEDKGLLLQQYLREMKDNLHQKQERQQLLTQTIHQLQCGKESRQQEIDKLNQDIDLAVGKSKDDIARALIFKRCHLEAGRRHIDQQLTLISEELQTLDQVVTRQHLQYDQMKLKVDAYMCRERICRPETGDVDHLDIAGHGPTHDEVELELLQRKEAQNKGGDS